MVFLRVPAASADLRKNEPDSTQLHQSRNILSCEREQLNNNKAQCQPMTDGSEQQCDPSVCVGGRQEMDLLQETEIF